VSGAGQALAQGCRTHGAPVPSTHLPHPWAVVVGTYSLTCTGSAGAVCSVACWVTCGTCLDVHQHPARKKTHSFTNQQAASCVAVTPDGKNYKLLRSSPSVCCESRPSWPLHRCYQLTVSQGVCTSLISCYPDVGVPVVANPYTALNHTILLLLLLSEHLQAYLQLPALPNRGCTLLGADQFCTASQYPAYCSCMSGTTRTSTAGRDATYLRSTRGHQPGMVCFAWQVLAKPTRWQTLPQQARCDVV
jgi:hypothetical protein